MDIHKLCSKYGVVIELEPGISARIRMDRLTWVCNKVIYMGEDMPSQEEEASVWHELGHMQHKLGLYRDSCLTRELAADTWALSNYDGGDKAGLVKYLREWILTYIQADPGYEVFDTAIGNEELKQTALTLGIYDLITWTKEED